MTFEKQIAAIETALMFIQRLPPGSTWALSVTDDDDGESASTLSIFAEKEQWPGLQERLKLGRPMERGLSKYDEQFTSYRYGTLLISLIEEVKLDE